MRATSAQHSSLGATGPGSIDTSSGSAPVSFQPLLRLQCFIALVPSTQHPLHTRLPQRGDGTISTSAGNVFLHCSCTFVHDQDTWGQRIYEPFSSYNYTGGHRGLILLHSVQPFALVQTGCETEPSRKPSFCSMGIFKLGQRAIKSELFTELKPHNVWNS